MFAGSLPCWLIELHRDRGGQVSFLAIFGVTVFFGLIGMVMTTGDQVSQKMKMQDAVDTAALSGGIWIARGLNVTSAFNVIQSQLVDGAILLDALDHALEHSRPVVKQQVAFFSLCAGFNSLCALALELTRTQLQVLSALNPAVDELNQSLAECEQGLFWVVAEALEQLNRVVQESFYSIASAETLAIARRNGAVSAALVPGPIVRRGRGRRPTLPTEKRSFTDLCDPMAEGSPESDERGYHSLLGYPVTVGPYRLGKRRIRPLLRTLTGVPPVGWPIFERRADQVMKSFCEGEKETCRRVLPQPYLLRQEKDALMFLAIARKPNRQIFFRGGLLEDPPELFTYAQVEIYNGISNDAFSQDWRVRLAPAGLLEYPFRGPSGFGDLDRWPGRLANVGDIRRVNNH